MLQSTATTSDPARSLLEQGARALGIPLAADACDRLLRYLAELQRWNGAYNLTAVREPVAMVRRHLIDSLSVLPQLRGRVLDVGSGPGLPGIVLAIAEPQLQITVLDSNGKKARFMRHAVRQLALDNVEVVEARVEEYHPEQAYDCIVSRAFASLADFFTLTRHLLAPGGQWVAMKGRLDDHEQTAVQGMAQVQQILRVQVPGLDEARHFIVALPA